MVHIENSLYSHIWNSRWLSIYVYWIWLMYIFSSFRQFDKSRINSKKNKIKFYITLIAIPVNNALSKNRFASYYFIIREILILVEIFLKNGHQNLFLYYTKDTKNNSWKISESIHHYIPIKIWNFYPRKYEYYAQSVFI